jgi:hypothetical protein
MKMDLTYESSIDLSPRHITALRNLINALMKSVGEHGEFRIELGGSLHYGTYMVTGEMVEVRLTPLKKQLRKKLATTKPQKKPNSPDPVFCRLLLDVQPR